MAIIYKNPHQQALASVQQELEQRLQQQQWIARRIAELKAAITTLAPLAQDEFNIPVSMNLPQLCLRVLSFSPKTYVSVPNIREGLAVMGVDLSSYKNPLAVLHTTMGRLEENGYVTAADGHVDGRGYQILPAGMLFLQQVL